MPHPVYLVRHGQSEWNVARRTQGQVAHPRLTEVGRAQAAAAADVIAADLTTHLRAPRCVMTRVITSDLTRAVETAQVVADRLGAAVSHDARLREQALGHLEGCTYEETFAAAEAHDWSDPTRPVVAGAESPMQVYVRMAAVLAEVGASRDPAALRSGRAPRSAQAPRSADATVLVSHGDAIRMAVASLRGQQPHEADWVEVPNGAVARIDAELTWLAQ